MNGLERAIAILGSQIALAKTLGVGAMAVTQWKTRGVPAERVPEIVSATGGAVLPHELRPDLYAPTDQGASPQDEVAA